MMRDRGMMGLPGAVQAFEPGAQAREWQGGDVIFWTRPIGDLIVPTGRIAACDPCACAEARVFARKVPLGTYPVLVALSEFARAANWRNIGRWWSALTASLPE